MREAAMQVERIREASKARQDRVARMQVLGWIIIVGWRLVGRRALHSRVQSAARGSTHPSTVCSLPCLSPCLRLCPSDRREPADAAGGAGRRRVQVCMRWAAGAPVESTAARLPPCPCPPPPPLLSALCPVRPGAARRRLKPQGEVTEEMKAVWAGFPEELAELELFIDGKVGLGGGGGGGGDQGTVAITGPSAAGDSS